MAEPTLEDLEKRFTYHTPMGDQSALYEAIRASFLHLAQYVVDRTPLSRERSLFLTSLEEAMFWANASIARYDNR